jgi:hypothetical protein
MPIIIIIIIIIIINCVMGDQIETNERGMHVVRMVEGEGCMAFGGETRGQETTWKT